MKIRLLDVICCVSLGFTCCYFKENQIADYPYLRTGDTIYRDIRPYDMKPSTSMKEIFENSRFGALPELAEVERNGGVIIKEEQVEVVGDGGFPGFLMIREGNFPWHLRVIIPDLESKRIMTLERVSSGWFVTECLEE